MKLALLAVIVSLVIKNKRYNETRVNMAHKYFKMIKAKRHGKHDQLDGEVLYDLEEG